MATKPSKRMTTKKVVGGMKDLWASAKSDFVDNTMGLKQDFKDLVEIARSKAKRSAKEPRPRPLALLDSAVNQDAGADILSHYKEEWVAMHRRTEETTQLVSRMDSDLQDIHNSLSRSHSIVETCRTEFETLPSVVKAVEAARQKVEEIGKLLKQVEEDMLENSRTNAQLGAERRHHSLKIQSEKHREQQSSELKRLEGVLAEEKRLTVERQLELESQKIQERQQTFQDIFDQQMADYRERGEVERPITGDRERSGSQLEEVEIEDEGATASLNEFLSDVVLESAVSPEQREGSLEREESGGTKEESHEQKEDSGDQSHDQPEGEDEEDIFHDVSES